KKYALSRKSPGRSRSSVLQRDAERLVFCPKIVKSHKNISSVPPKHQYLKRMKRHLTLAVLGIIVHICMLEGQVPFECKGQFYISFTTPTTSSLVEAVIDPITDQVEFLTINDNLQTFINGTG